MADSVIGMEWTGTRGVTAGLEVTPGENATNVSRMQNCRGKEALRVCGSISDTRQNRPRHSL